MTTRNPVFIDRVETKFEVGIAEDEVAEFWRALSSYLPQFGLMPVQNITCVGSVYFDNKDYDLLRYSLLIDRASLHVRLRTYEYFDKPDGPISEFWMEVKNREEERRRKKRFRVLRPSLADFLEGRDVEEDIMNSNQEGESPEILRALYRETRETLLTMGMIPALLVTYKRVAFQSDTERLSLDWDIKYYDARPNMLFYDSWKYLIEEPQGKPGLTLLEYKFPEGSLPVWLPDLQRKYPIWQRNYSKFVGGMSFLLPGSHQNCRESESFLRMIDAHRPECRGALG